MEFNWNTARETAHLRLHRGPRRAETTKCIRETEAEAVAYVVCEAIGLKAQRVSDYIQLYSGDKETLTESLEHVQRAAPAKDFKLTLPATGRRPLRTNRRRREGANVESEITKTFLRTWVADRRAPASADLGMWETMSRAMLLGNRVLNKAQNVTRNFCSAPRKLDNSEK